MNRSAVFRATFAAFTVCVPAIGGFLDEPHAVSFQNDRGRARISGTLDAEAYWFELVGCQVETPNGDVVGRVRELWDTPAHATLVVVGVDGRERLIPAAPALLRQLDVAAKRIVIEDLPGLIDPIE